jgi:hypothetical protein
MVTEKIKQIDIPRKKVEDMKTSELIDEMNNDFSDDGFKELEDELLNRYPFSYYFKTKIELLEQDIDLLNRLLRHDHKDGKILIPL